MYRSKKRAEQKRILTAWMLILMLMPMMLVKSFHHHEGFQAHAVTNESSAAHSTLCSLSSDAQCPICHFYISPIEEATDFRLATSQDYVPAERVTYAPHVVKSCHLLHGLRAPPSL